MRRPSLRELVIVVAVAATVLAPTSLVARGPNVAAPSLPTLAPAPAALPSGGRITLAPGYAPAPGARALGPVVSDPALSVAVGLASRDPQGLAAYVNASEVPGTLSYRHFLSAGQADARFGASPASVGAAEAYLEAQGLTTAVNPDGLILSVSGPVRALDRAFDTTFERYLAANGTTFVSPASPASLPAVAPWTGAFGLTSNVVAEPSVSAGADPVTPSACFGIDGANNTPQELATAYDYAELEAGGTNGTGETIAVIDAYSSAENQTELLSNADCFSTANGLPPPDLSFLYPVPTTADLNASGTNPDWDVEDALDVEWSHAAAPGAAIEMVFSPNAGAGLYFAIDWVVAHHAADILSMSWGEPEVGVYDPATMPCSSACNASTDGSFDILGPVLELAAAEGMTAFAASGDCGAADGTTGVSVSYPASDPYVTGVGATALTTQPNGTYVSETAWNGNSSAASGGCSNEGGSGGGFSVLPHPWWQVGPGTVASNGRGVPDVAMIGAGASPVWVLTQTAWLRVSGTSVGTPIWAGLGALADQHAAGSLGLLNPSLYRILDGSGYAANFHEIVEGSNGYSTHAGWNPVTGIGTPIFGNLIDNLTRTATTLDVPQVLVYASPRFGPAPLTVKVALSVHGGSGTYPLEGVDFGDGNASTVTAGTVTHTFNAPGVYSVQGYAVDSGDNLSASPPVVVVVGAGGPLQVRLGASTQSPALGQAVTFTATATGGVAPYTYNFSFGDGAYAVNLTANATSQAYPVAGGFCAEVVVHDNASARSGAASLRVPVAVGGAVAPTCGNPGTPLTVKGNVTEGVRDAPADFPSLFSVTGGAAGPSELADQVALVSNEADHYPSACDCAIFRTAGTYEVQEWVNDTVDGSAWAETNVTVAPALNATFSASTLSGTVPLTVRFAASVTGGYGASAARTRWSLDDGSNATGSSAEANYTTPGEYVVLAQLSDDGDGNASEAFLLDVRAAGSTGVGLDGTIAPAVNLSSGTTVSWNATEVGPTSAVAGTVVAWNLGNGGSAFGPTANETYFAPIDLLAGNRLYATVSVDSGRLAHLLVVPLELPSFFATEAGGFVPGADALELSENVAPGVGVAPLRVDGTATATGPGGAAVGWTFGDGATATGAVVSTVYYAAGDYTVAVRAFDMYDDGAQRLDTVATSLPLDLGGCVGTTRYVTAPASVSLSAAATGGDGPPYTYRWTLPNGSTATTANVTIAFGSGGVFTVQLLVTDAANSTTSCAWSIVVTTPPAIPPVLVLAVGAAGGVGLAAVFLWATRPRARAPPPRPVSP
jgi:PKD repeat protein